MGVAEEVVQVAEGLLVGLRDLVPVVALVQGDQQVDQLGELGVDLLGQPCPQPLQRGQLLQGLLELLIGAVDLVEGLLRGEKVDVKAILAEAEAAARANDLGPSTSAIVKAAARRSVPWRRLNDANLVQLGHGHKRRLIQASITGATSHVAVEIASDKKGKR